MKFHLISLGCQMNISDSERVKTMLHSMGYTETKQEEDAELIGVMACSVRQKAIDKIYSLIHKWEQWKQKKPLITFISGCILPVDREKFLKRFDILFSINELPQLPTLLQQYGITTPYAINPTLIPIQTNKKGSEFPHKDNNSNIDEKDALARGFWQIAPSYSSTFEAYVTIQNGCDKFCTFCAVPYTRGREVSRASSEILQEVYMLMKKGYVSITLLGQNVNSYGIDTHGKELTFAQLLERIGNMAEELHHECWVYFTSPHPRDMTRDVLETIAKYPALAKQIHLPLQSGDDKLLMRMNRNHSMSRYDRVVQDIRTILPTATLFTDIIVGFCGETEEQFLNTAHAMKKYQYNMAYIAMYSPRIGAASSRWVDDVPMDVKKQRYHSLSSILQETARASNSALIHTAQNILVEKVLPVHQDMRAASDTSPSVTLQGRTEGKIPVRLSMTDTSISAAELQGRATALVGTFVTARVTGVHNLSLECVLETLPTHATQPHKEYTA